MNRPTWNLLQSGRSFLDMRPLGCVCKLKEKIQPRDLSSPLSPCIFYYSFACDFCGYKHPFCRTQEYGDTLVCIKCVQRIELILNYSSSREAR